MREKVVFSFSSGKDSVYALHKLSQSSEFEVVKVFSTFSTEYKRVNFHAIPPPLIDLQTLSLGIEPDKIFLTKSKTVDEHREKLEPYFLDYKKSRINKIAFGDISLEELKQFRDDSLCQIGMSAVYPLWGTDKKELLEDFVNLGFKAILTCINTDVLDKSFLGMTIDKDFISKLPENIDICGENGEYHSFVFDGPGFKFPITLNPKKQFKSANFAYLELV